LSNGRVKLSVPKDSIVLVASDAHYWPNNRSTAHRALVEFAKEMKPHAIIMNGDVIDGASISRHPPIGWEGFPTLQEELEVAKERLEEIQNASPKSMAIWTLGNHDARFETRLASLVPQYANVTGVHLKDHFPKWIPAWSVEVGGRNGAIIKHRFSGGSNSAYNNALKSGRSIVTGHDHRMGLRPVSDYTGTRWGVNGGMLADREGPQWTYTEDNPHDWQSGFVVLPWRQGRLLMPELLHVVKAGQIEWRGELMNV
jgi:predicted phosphodiesterase